MTEDRVAYFDHLTLTAPPRKTVDPPLDEWPEGKARLYRASLPNVMKFDIRALSDYITKGLGYNVKHDWIMRLVRRLRAENVILPARGTRVIYFSGPNDPRVKMIISLLKDSSLSDKL